MSKKINPAIAAAAETIAPEVALVATTAIAPFQAISMNLDISLIDPSPLNPRTIFSDEGIQELSDSIQKYGLQSEILVRPKNGRYELIYGERRLRASKKAGLTTIRAKCEDLSDSEAKIRAFIENLQRENLTPIEEGDAFVRLLDEPDMTVKRLCADLGKSEGYVRTRINLMKLIPEVVELLNNKEISLEIAKEFANYSKDIQQTVCKDHFKENGYFSWRGISAKEFSERLYSRYMTQLDNYSFDKTECNTCEFNTLQQKVLFSFCSDCGGCQKTSCLQAKNEAYMVKRSVDLITNDPRVHLMKTTTSNKAVVDQLTEMGHDISDLEKSVYNYDNGPRMPQKPDAEESGDADDYQCALEEYEKDLERFKERCTELEYSVTEGKVLKYAVIEDTDVKIYYEKVRAETTTQNGVTVTTVPVVPAKDLKQKDERNHEICITHITKELKKVLHCEKKDFPKTEITPREQQFFHYILLSKISDKHREILGLKTDYSSKTTERMKYAANLTDEQKTMLMRMTIMSYCDDMYEYNCKPDSANSAIITEFSTLHFPDQANPIIDRYKGIFEKRHVNLVKRIDAIEKQAENMRIQSMFEAGALWKMPDGTILNILTGEILDENVVFHALPDAEIPEYPIEEQPEGDFPEPDIEEPQTEDEPEGEYPDDPYEFIPFEDAAMKTGKGQKSKAKSKAKPKAKTLRISPKKTKLAA